MGAGRFELPTSSLSATRSNQLSYAPVQSKYFMDMCLTVKAPIEILRILQSFDLVSYYCKLCLSPFWAVFLRSFCLFDQLSKQSSHFDHANRFELPTFIVRYLRQYWGIDGAGNELRRLWSR